MLQRSPGHADALHLFGVLHAQADALEEALPLLSKAVRRAPRSAGFLSDLANALRGLGRLDEAVASVEQALALRPESATFQANLGMIHVARRDHAAALACFRSAAGLHHGAPLASAAPKGPQEEQAATPVAPFKLQHDAEQIRHLCGSGAIDDSFARVAETDEQMLAALPADAPPDEPVVLDPREWRRIAPGYNRPLRLPEAPALADGAVNPGLDAGASEQAWRARAPNLAVVDDFLSADALERLWRFCLDATVWYQAKRGYLGAYLVDGFATALALQIADELGARLPGIFGAHRLNQLWAYKYDSRLQGIATHADFAAVNVNFWITPDEANRNPGSGGLVMHTAHAPSD